MLDPCMRGDARGVGDLDRHEYLRSPGFCLYTFHIGHSDHGFFNDVGLSPVSAGITGCAARAVPTDSGRSCERSLVRSVFRPLSIFWLLDGNAVGRYHDCVLLHFRVASGPGG